MGMYQRPFWRLCADVGRRSAPGLRKTITVTTFYSSSNVILPGNREIRAEGTVRLAVRADLAAPATPRVVRRDYPPVVHLGNEAPAQSLTDQDIDDRLVRGVVISNTALAIRQAKARPGFGARAPYTRTWQVAGAGEAQLAQAAGQSRDVRC